MLKELNEYIAVKGFCYLVIDYECNAQDGLPPYCSGRVLCEGLFQYNWHAETREEAIEKFLNGDLKAEFCANYNALY